VNDGDIKKGGKAKGRRKLIKKERQNEAMLLFVKQIFLFEIRHGL
jgi:hypothetical protein